MKGSILAARRSSCVKCPSTKFKSEKNPIIGFNVPLCTECGNPPNRLRVRKTIPGVDGKGITKDFQVGLDGKPLTTIANALALLGRMNDELKEGTYRVEDYDSRARKELEFDRFTKTYLDYKEKRTRLPQEHDDFLTPAAFKNSKWLAGKVLVNYFKNTNLKDIDKFKIKEFERSWTEKFRTRDLALGELRTMLNFAKREMGLLREVPDFPRIKRARQRKADEIPSPEIQSAIISKIKHSAYKAAWITAAVYAKRSCEVRAYKVKDVNLAKKTLKTQRHFSDEKLLAGRKSIKVDHEMGTLTDHLDEFMVKLLTPFVIDRDPEEFLFPNKRSGFDFIRDDALDRAWRVARTEAGFSWVKPYTGTKHATLTEILRQTGNYGALKAFSGHTNVITLERYAKLKNDDKRDFANSERFK